MIKHIIISLIIMTVLIIGGCRMIMPFKEKEPESMELTEQQKQILSKEGLPHDYSKLDYIRSILE